MSFGGLGLRHRSRILREPQERVIMAYFHSLSRPKGKKYRVKPLPGPSVDLLCVRESDATPFRENYAKLYFDGKHIEKGLNVGW